MVPLHRSILRPEPEVDNCLSGGSCSGITPGEIVHSSDLPVLDLTLMIGTIRTNIRTYDSLYSCAGT